MADPKRILGGLGKASKRLFAEREPAYSPKVLESTTARFADKIADANPKLTDAEVQKKALAQATKKLEWERVQKPALEKQYGALGKASFVESNPSKMQNTAEVVAERKRKANEFLDQPTEPWTPPRKELQAFDRASIKDALEGFPDVEQSSFPRDVPTRASTSHVEELYSDPENRALIEKQIKRGLPLGGETFYASLYPVKQAVLEAGMPAEKFDRWIHSLAPASARNSIVNEMAVGQFLRNMNARGIPLTEENVAKEMAAYKDKFGIGLPLMPLHRQGVQSVLEGGQNLREMNKANVPTNYKIPTYGSQKAGDFAKSVTLDVHEAAGQTQGSRYHPYFKEQGGFGNTEYNVGEQGLLGIAEDLGIPGGMAQAGRWFGGGELTGLRSPRGDALDLLEKQVAFTLKQKGIQPNPANVRKEVLKQIETGEGDLLPYYRKEGMPDVRETGLQRAEGGAVDIDAADARLEAAMQARMSGGMAKGGSVDIKAADARLEAAMAQRMAGGGGAFKKIAFMQAGGAAKGVAKGFKKLFADRDVMPAIERDANLQKFLEPSKTPMRLYHGTTATEGGKGQEAIRRIKPSKEGALGSGVYMTPNTAHASSYTGIPNDDALAMMGQGNDYTKKMADQFMADRASGTLREGQAGGNMLPVHAQIRNPLIIGKSGRNIDPAADALMSLGMDEASAIKLVEKAFEEKGNIGKQIQTRAQAQGYDGIMQYRGDNLSEVVSYRPNAVKSAIGNRGTYDINEADLSKAHGGLAMASGGSLQDDLKKNQSYSVLDQKKPNELGGVILSGASWMAGDEKTRLAKEAFGQDVTNTAIGGQKTSDVLNQLNVFERDGGTFAPGATVVLDIGANDIAQGVDQGTIRKNLDEIVSRLGAYGVNVILSGQPLARSYDEAISSTTLRMDDLYNDIASNHSNVTLVDAMSGMLNDKTLMDESGFHLNSDDAKLAYLNQFANAYKGNQGAVDIPAEIAQITQTSQPAVVDSEPVRSGGYNAAMQGDGLETYYQNINTYLAEPRTQEEIQDAMQFYSVSQEDIDMARDYQPSGGKFEESYATEQYAEGGGAFKTLQWAKPQNFDGGGIASPEENNTYAPESFFDSKRYSDIKKNAAEMFAEGKQSLASDYERLKNSPRARAQLAKISAAQIAGGAPDIAHLGINLIVDPLKDVLFTKPRPRSVLEGPAKAGEKRDRVPMFGSIGDALKTSDGLPIGSTEHIIKRAQDAGLMYGSTTPYLDVNGQPVIDPDTEEPMQIRTGRFGLPTEIGGAILGGSALSKLGSAAKKGYIKNIEPRVDPAGALSRAITDDSNSLLPSFAKNPLFAPQSVKLTGVQPEAKTASTGKPKGATYATKQEGPFYRVSPTFLDVSGAKNRGIREASELQGEGTNIGATGQAGREVPQLLSPEEVGRIIADPVANQPLQIAQRFTKETQGNDFVKPDIPESSLAKQSAIGRAQQLAVEGSPEYKSAVFDAYAKQMPDLLEQVGAKNYDDLMEKAYRQMAKETDEQFKRLPYNFSYHRAGEGNYNGAMDMASDVHGNKHLYVYQGGDPHDFLNRLDKASGLNENEKFRAVHDLLGHAIYGNQFGPKGEEMAWAVHQQMYSPLARLAMTAETRGQNSMVNYSPLNVKVKSEIAGLDELEVQALRKGDKALVDEIRAAKRQAYSNFEFAPNKAVLLPPEFVDPKFTGGLPDYLSAANRPAKGTETQSVLTHFSHNPNLQFLDPTRYGTGIKGAEAERLREYAGGVKDRSYVYLGEPGTIAPESGLGVNRYRGESQNLYDITKDPLSFRALARESNRTPFTAKVNAGITSPLQEANDYERLVKEYGYEGMINPNASKPMGIMFKPTPVQPRKRGGLTQLRAR